MISIHPLGRGPAVADYYLTRRECDDLGYYVGHDQLPGRWVWSGAAALGLRHDFGPGDGELLRGFLSGRGLDGSALVPSVMRRDDKGQPYDVRRVGFAVTCSAPKSVSVLYALGDADVAGQVAAAHRTAVWEALEVLERLSARAARGHQGDGHRARRIPTSGLIGAAFDHDPSRLLDPQLHTHVVIANVVCGVDGRWSAVDSQTMVRQATTVSYLYQAVLRAELTRRLGVAWTGIEKGIAEIDGIPREVLRAFSKRRDQIERALEDRGLSGTAAAQAACLATRLAKQNENAGTPRDRWLAEATRLGFDARDVSQLLRRERRPGAVVREALAARVLGPEGVTRETSTFDRGELVREVCQHLPPGADVTGRQVLALAGELLREDDVVPVLSNDGVAYTTVDMLAVEQATLDAVTARAAEHLAVVEGLVVDTALASTQLRPDQVALVRDITLSGRGVEIISGPAGSGKTRALATAVASWTSTGVDVCGVAVAAITADGLRVPLGHRRRRWHDSSPIPNGTYPPTGFCSSTKLAWSALGSSPVSSSSPAECAASSCSSVILLSCRRWRPAVCSQPSAAAMRRSISRATTARSNPGRPTHSKRSVQARRRRRSTHTPSMVGCTPTSLPNRCGTSWSPTTSCTGQRSTTRVRYSSWLVPARRPTGSTTSCVLDSSRRNACRRPRCACRQTAVRSTAELATRSS